MTEAVDDSPISAPGEPSEDPPSGATRDLLEWVGIVAGALIVALLVKTFLIQAFFIPSLSMFPTLHEGDRVLVNKLSYRFGDIERGDIVVFERPPNAPDDGVKDLIKRVVGLPGDTLEARDGALYVNGERQHEPYVDTGDQTENLNRQVVPDHMLFVMGDNRSNSSDSRKFGPVDEDLVVGRAFVTVWPLNKLTLL